MCTNGIINPIPVNNVKQSSKYPIEGDTKMKVFTGSLSDVGKFCLMENYDVTDL